MLKILILSVMSVVSSSVLAVTDLKIHNVAENVYALVGELTNRSKDNLGNNSTHGVIVTDDGVILMDSGGTYLGAKQIHETIKKITDKPIKIVINTGGQDHRWFGNSYFKSLNARIISSNNAKDDHIARTDSQMTRLSNLIGDAIKGTEPTVATEYFDEELKLSFGGVNLELYHAGPAHTAGDLFVWMPKTGVMFTGDIVYNNRMLGIGPAQNFRSWISVFEKMASYKPKHIIPGHGDPSTLETATKNTYEYLVLLKDKVGDVLENDGGMLEASRIDQSSYKYLENFDSIAGKNAQWVFEQMEFE